MSTDDLLKELIETQKETNEFLKSGSNNTKMAIRVTMAVFAATFGLSIILFALKTIFDAIQPINIFTVTISTGTQQVFIAFIYALAGALFLFIGGYIFNRYMTDFKKLFAKPSLPKKVEGEIPNPHAKQNEDLDIQKEILAKLTSIEEKNKIGEKWAIIAIGLAYVLFGLNYYYRDNIVLANFTILAGVVIICVPYIKNRLERRKG
jgi:MFS family permease